jgi:hypothetical protein
MYCSRVFFSSGYGLVVEKKYRKRIICIKSRRGEG